MRTHRRAGRIGACLAVLLVGVGVAVWFGSRPSNTNTAFRFTQSNAAGTLIAPDRRRAAGTMSGDLLSGAGTYTLAAHRGDVVAVNFLASWCGSCQTETPNYERIYQQRRASGVTFVGVDIKDARDGARAWVADKVKATFPIIYDPLAKIALQLGRLPVSGLPGTVLIDKQGRVAAVYVGPQLPADLNPVLDTLSRET